MISPALPDTETNRIAALRAFQILDTPPEPTFDRITALAAQIFGVPAALVSLVDEERQWFKSCYGPSPFTRVNRVSSFCAHAILEHSVFVVEDATQDVRFYDHPVVISEPGVRFYAGAPLTIRGGLNIGTLCLVDVEPRTFSVAQRKILAGLADCIVDALEARESRRLLASEIVQREQAEKQLQAILDNTTSVIYLKDCEGHYTMVNRSFERIFGQSRASLIGKTDREILPPDVLAKIRHNDLDVQRQGQAIEFEEIIEQEDGQHTYISVKFPIRDSSDDISGICGISTDITGRILAETALRRSEARKTAILEAALDGIVTIDHLGRIVEINGAMTRIFGYRAEEMVGFEMAELIIPPELRDAHRHGMQRLMASGKSTILDQRLDLPAMRSDGSIFPVELTITQILADGPPMFTGHLRDITERKEAENTLREAKEEAERANSAKSHFLSRMSHELRTPLNAILGFGQVLNRRAQDDWHREKTGFIVDAGNHLLNLINEVLDLTRIESGQTHLALGPVELWPLLRDCRTMTNAEAARRSVQIEIMSENEAVSAIADHQRLKQIFLNLLSNAAKYNRPDGHIIISIESRGEQVAIHVRDTGIGIASEKMSRLFVPFDRLGAEETEVEGTGIGLVLSRQLVELMGGRLTATSILHEGSVFTVVLPTAKTSATHETSFMEPVASERQNSPERPKGTVLYAEDNEFNVLLMEEIAEEHGGVHLVTVMRGPDVLPRAREVKPKLILLDLHLPGMNGDQILREIRADAELQSIPVIVVSADAMKAQVERLLHEGATEYLTKPFEVARTLHLFDHYLHS